MSRKQLLSVYSFILTACIALILTMRAIGQEGAPSVPGAALTTGFTYQGYLEENGSSVDETCDFQFILWDSEVGGAQVGATQTTTGVSVTDGRFTVSLNEANEFGDTAFTGQARWLEIWVRCPAGSGNYTPLNPRQELASAPYALSLRPGAVISGTVPTGSSGILTLNSNDVGLRIISIDDSISVSSGDKAISVSSAGDDGFYVNSAGNDGIQVGNAGQDGLEASVSGRYGVFIANSGDDGVRINNAGDNGVEIGTTVSDGIFIDNPGDDAIDINSPGGDGIFICNTGNVSGCAVDAGNHGIEIGKTDDDAMHIISAGTDGTEVDLAIAGDGLQVDDSGFNGVEINGVADWEGYFFGDINVTGSCTGCLLATFALNVGDRPLQPGELVAIRAIQAPSGTIENLSVQFEVVPAGTGETVLGIVAGRAEMVADDDDAARILLVPREGPAAVGEYAHIVIYGLVQVQVTGPIEPGQKLTVASDGVARALQTVLVEGIEIAENTPVMGTALEGLVEGETRLIWVLVNIQ